MSLKDTFEDILAQDSAPPQWAIDRALSYGPGWKTAFARYIAEHEQPPVDPLLVEARRIVAETWRRVGSKSYADRVEEGLCDDGIYVPIALTAIRRGIEIGATKS